MNLVNLIKDQLTSEVTSRLGSLIGGSETQTKAALGAAIPALLSALSGLASSGAGDKLASTLNAFTNEMPAKFAGELSQNPGPALDQGNRLLESLLGGSALAGLASVLSKFVGLDAGALKKLLAFAAPFVMGAISKQFQGKPATAQSLQGLFAEQKSNIAAAMPAGLSLSGIPGLPDLGSIANNAAATVRKSADMAQDAGSPLMKKLLPVGLLALLAFVGWQFFQKQKEKQSVENVAQSPVTNTVQKPVLDATAAVPNAAQVSDGLTSVFSQATEILSKITDAASADAALPKLDQLSTQVDGLALLWDKIPASARSTIVKLTTDHLGKLTPLIDQVLAIPGVGEKLQPALDGLVAKLKSFDGDR